MATDDPRVHVQDFDTTDTGPLGTGANTTRRKDYEIPIIGFKTWGKIAFASFTAGLLTTKGHTQIR
jgi:hypothetical protein